MKPLRPVAIIGSTGSIGTQTLDVVRHFPEQFRVTALAAGSDLEGLARQVREFRPELVSVSTAAAAARLRERLGASAPDIDWGESGLIAVATHPGAEAVLTSVVGTLGLRPTLAAIQSGKRILLANKETLVAAGTLVMAAAAAHGVDIIPVDSEHNAIHQCLAGNHRQAVQRLMLTASGGPFLGRQWADLVSVAPEAALRHPRWKMGPKVTIDSATMMNKALEIIEAHHLFAIPVDQVDVVVHPQSLVHSLVEYVDGSIIAQLAVPDMRLPIQYALFFPERHAGPTKRLDLTTCGPLTFLAPDHVTFPSLLYARQAVKMGGAAPAVLNAANEVAVDRFLRRQIRFTDIFRIVDAALTHQAHGAAADVEAVLAADGWARRFAASLVF